MTAPSGEPRPCLPPHHHCYSDRCWARSNLEISTAPMCKCCCPCIAVCLNQGCEKKSANFCACLLGPLYTGTGCWTPVYDPDVYAATVGIARPGHDMER